MLRRAVEIELKLAVLVDRAERRDRRRPLAVLAEALAPELHVPGGEARQAVAIGEHHVGADAAFLGKADGDGGADRPAQSRPALLGVRAAHRSRSARLRAAPPTSSPRASAGSSPTLVRPEKRPPILGS